MKILKKALKLTKVDKKYAAGARHEQRTPRSCSCHCD